MSLEGLLKWGENSLGLGTRSPELSSSFPLVVGSEILGTHHLQDLGAPNEGKGGTQLRKANLPEL